MPKKPLFKDLRKTLEQYDQKREWLIRQSRDILKASKKAIYSAHRGNLAKAKEHLAAARNHLRKAEQLAKKDAKLATTGIYSDAQEEYAEASIYAHYLKHKNLPPPGSLGVDAHTYLAALCDVVGELVRKAINSVTKGDYTTALEIKDTVEALYDELMLFDWGNLPIRKKFDSIKYNLEKLEDLALKIKLKK